MKRNMSKKNSSDYYPGYCHPKSLIAYLVWQYHRFMLSLRDVSELLVMRGIQVSYETIREWGLKFGQTDANDIKRRATRRDEMCLVMKGKKHWLWREVDQDGFELDILLQSRKNKQAAKLWRSKKRDFTWS
jgi:putative transposase